MPLVSNWMLTGIGMRSLGNKALIYEWTLGQAEAKRFEDLSLVSVWMLAGNLGRCFGHMALTVIGVGFFEDMALLNR